MADGGKKWNKLKNWKPPVFLSILLAAVLTALTLAVLLTEEGKAVPARMDAWERCQSL